MGGPSVEFSFELKESQMAFIKEMTAKYDLTDESKALRCLINYAIDESDREQEIFEDIRCLDC